MLVSCGNFSIFKIWKYHKLRSYSLHAATARAKHVKYASKKSIQWQFIQR